MKLCSIGRSIKISSPAFWKQGHVTDMVLYRRSGAWGSIKKQAEETQHCKSTILQLFFLSLYEWEKYGDIKFDKIKILQTCHRSC